MTIGLAEKYGKKAFRLGTAVFDPDKKIIIRPLGITSDGDRFVKGELVIKD